MNNKTIKTIIWVCVFSIAMAFLETAIVVYLRKLYYPEGFAFPLKVIDPAIAVTEIFREFSTIIMLAGIGIIAGRKNIERFAYFIFSFAVWDIFYYVFLKIILNWPESILTWDILFLIPMVWVGPVLAPIINSITMIALTFIIIYFVWKKGNAITEWQEWSLLIIGSLVVIFSYTYKFSFFMLDKFSFYEIVSVDYRQKIIEYACTYVPQYFNWWIFLTGELMHIAAIVLIVKRNKKIPASN